MEKVNRLSERILNRFEQHRNDLADKQQQLDSKMIELLEQRERLAAVAKHKIETVILPRMEELARHFEMPKLWSCIPTQIIAASANSPIHRDSLQPSSFSSRCCRITTKTSLPAMT